MKMLFLTLCLMPGLALARYEDLVGEDGNGEMADINLLFYAVAGLTVWTWMVWDGGWRKRWIPLALAGGFAVAFVGWGYQGLGFMTMMTFLGTFLAGILGAFKDK
jgi:hypothetical protein